MILSEKEILSYIDEVNLLMEKAYVPYSKFPVATLLIDDNGNKHKGVNIWSWWRHLPDNRKTGKT